MGTTYGAARFCSAASGHRLAEDLFRDAHAASRNAFFLSFPKRFIRTLPSHDGQADRGNCGGEVMKQVIMLMVLAGIASGCAGNPRPIVDQKDVDREQYLVDLAECEELGREVDVAKGMARGALLGAAVGAAVGVLVGDFGTDATFGGIVGGAGSGLENEYTRQSVVKECMRVRGYVVLN
jgi:outer membrane lipoprotein SlyB